MPEYAEPAAKTSGYEPASTFVIMPPEDEPMTKTFEGSALYFAMVAFTMEMMPVASPAPLLCVSDPGEWTSQQFDMFGVDG